jgi:uncharacterized membrane protein
MKKILYILIPAFISVLAIPALAAIKNFKELIQVVFLDGLISPLVPLLIGLAVVVFIYGVLTTMLSEGGEKKEEGKQYMFWGIIGIFVMVSLWGLVNIVKGTFRLDDNNKPAIEIVAPRI